MAHAPRGPMPGPRRAKPRSQEPTGQKTQASVMKADPIKAKEGKEAEEAPAGGEGGLVPLAELVKEHHGLHSGGCCDASVRQRFLRTLSLSRCRSRLPLRFASTR